MLKKIYYMIYIYLKQNYWTTIILDILLVFFIIFSFLCLFILIYALIDSFMVLL